MTETRTIHFQEVSTSTCGDGCCHYNDVDREGYVEVTEEVYQKVMDAERQQEYFNVSDFVDMSTMKGYATDFNRVFDENWNRMHFAE
jgi:hypothetical protein